MFPFFWFLFSVAVGVYASNKGRNGFGWFFLALLISPLIAFVFALAVRDLSAAGGVFSPVTHLKCPACAEAVLREAVVCKHCGAKLVPQPFVPPADEIKDVGSRALQWLILAGLVAAFVFFGLAKGA